MDRFTTPLVLAALVALGCGDTIAATQIMAVIDAQPGIRSMTEKVHVMVRGGTGKESSWTVRHDAVVTSGGSISWPLEVALIPKGDDTERV